MGQTLGKDMCGCGEENKEREVYLPSTYYPYAQINQRYTDNHPRTYPAGGVAGYANNNEQDQTQIFSYSQQQQQQQYQQPLRKDAGLYNSQLGSSSKTQPDISFNHNNSGGYVIQQQPNQISPFADVMSPIQGEQNSPVEVSPFTAYNGQNHQLPNEGAVDKSFRSSARYNERVKRLAEIVGFAPVLRLTVIGSANLKKGLILTINAQGLLHGERNEKDGYTYFGCKKKPKRVDKFVRQTQIINDFIIPPTDPEQAKLQRGRHFQIKYDITNNFYCLVDLGVGFGAFKKIDIPHILRNHDLINFGLTLCTIKFITRQNPNKSFSQNAIADKSQIILRAQFFGGASNGEVYELNPMEFQEATLGRSDSCSLSFKDKLISKVQCMLSFNLSHGWVLRDGDGSQPSTNGTWLYIQAEEQIIEGMVFKANQTIFQASIL